MVYDISPPTCAANFLASNPGALLFFGRRVGNDRMIFGFETRFSYPTPAEQQCGLVHNAGNYVPIGIE